MRDVQDMRLVRKPFDVILNAPEPASDRSRARPQVLAQGGLVHNGALIARTGGIPLARSSNPDSISARALVLTPLAARGTNVKVAVTVLIVLPDGSTTAGEPYLSHSQQFNGVIRPGTWVPVTLPPGGRPGTAELDTDHIPTVSQVARVMAEALGGPAVDPVPPDEWRIILALGYVEHVIASAAFTPDQAQAIRQRIKRGV